MKYRTKIRNLLFQVGIGCLSMMLMFILNVKGANAYDTNQGDWPEPGVIVDKAWLDKNLSNKKVLFIALTKESEYNIDNWDWNYPGYSGEHISSSNPLWGEAVKTPWPWEEGKEHDSPDVLVYTMKGSAHIECKETGSSLPDGRKIYDCKTENGAPGMMTPLDPLSWTVAYEFEEMGISHGCPTCPNNDIDIVIYPERLPHDYLWATTLYWLLEFYGYPADKLHVLDGGLARWKNDGGATTSGPGPQIPAATFIPNVKPEIFADKTVMKAISGGLIKGVILDVRNPLIDFPGQNRPEDGGKPIEPGRENWEFPPWWDFMQGYYIKNDALYAWYDSVDGVGDPTSKKKSNKCVDINNCEWKSPTELQEQFDKILGTNFNKDDNITMY